MQPAALLCRRGRGKSRSQRTDRRCRVRQRKPVQPKPRRTGEEARLTRTSRSPTTTTRAVTTGAKPGLQPMAVGTGGKTLRLWNKQRNTRTQTRGANGGPPHHLRRQDLPTERPSVPGKTRLPDQRNPSTFDPMNGGVLFTKYKHTWLSFEKIHAKSGG